MSSLIVSEELSKIEAYTLAEKISFSLMTASNRDVLLSYSGKVISYSLSHNHERLAYNCFLETSISHGKIMRIAGVCKFAMV